MCLIVRFWHDIIIMGLQCKCVHLVLGKTSLKRPSPISRGGGFRFVRIRSAGAVPARTFSARLHWFISFCRVRNISSRAQTRRQRRAAGRAGIRSYGERSSVGRARRICLTCKAYAPVNSGALRKPMRKVAGSSPAVRLEK